jgi:integrase/recombinase XerD
MKLHRRSVADRAVWAHRRAFAAAGVPYFSPHRLRNTLVAFGQQRCRTPEEFKAWSQNLGHNQVLTTFTSYGSVPPPRQAAIFRGVVGNDSPPNAALDEFAAILAKYRRPAL